MLGNERPNKSSARVVSSLRSSAVAVVAAASMSLGCSPVGGALPADGEGGQTAGGGTSSGAGGNVTGTGASNWGSGGTAGVGSPEWCAVEQILETRCQLCHNDGLSYGAPMPLMTHDDLLAAAPTSGRPVYEVALERVQSTSSPMPPPPNSQLSAGEIATLQAWVAAGTPGGNCDVVVGTGGVGGNGGTGGAGGSSTGGSGGVDSCIDCGDYDGCPNGRAVRFLAHQNAVSGDTTPFDVTNVGSGGDPNSYECFYFQAPWVATTQMIGHRPVIDNVQKIHHWLLYASAEAPLEVTDGGRKSRCQLQSDPNRVLLAGWAPGSPGGNMPPDVGQDLPFGSRTFITLEVHYYNTQPGTPAQDRSGVEVCMTDTPRPNEATMHWLGTENINVPANASATAGDTCTPNLGIGETSTILAVWPHMHLIGTRMKLEVIRAGTGMRETIHDGAFAFDNQTVYTLPQPVTINSGDRLQTTCTYENTTTNNVVFGEGSNDEMCYMFTRAYPAGSLHNGKNGCLGPLCVPGGVNRCIDNENILTAINAL